jgi:hypothetical protein
MGDLMFVQKLKSRKFLLSVTALIFEVAKSDPKHAAMVAAVYVVVQGAIDLAVAVGVVSPS